MVWISCSDSDQGEYDHGLTFIKKLRIFRHPVKEQDPVIEQGPVKKSKNT